MCVCVTATHAADKLCLAISLSSLPHFRLMVFCRSDSDRCIAGALLNCDEGESVRCAMCGGDGEMERERERETTQIGHTFRFLFSSLLSLRSHTHIDTHTHTHTKTHTHTHTLSLSSLIQLLHSSLQSQKRPTPILVATGLSSLSLSLPHLSFVFPSASARIAASSLSSPLLQRIDHIRLATWRRETTDRQRGSYRARCVPIRSHASRSVRRRGRKEGEP